MPVQPCVGTGNQQLLIKLALIYATFNSYAASGITS